jgi:hypothetical protein
MRDQRLEATFAVRKRRLCALSICDVGAGDGHALMVDGKHLDQQLPIRKLGFVLQPFATCKCVLAQGSSTGRVACRLLGVAEAVASGLGVMDTRKEGKGFHTFAMLGCRNKPT